MSALANRHDVIAGQVLVRAAPLTHLLRSEQVVHVCLLDAVAAAAIALVHAFLPPFFLKGFSFGTGNGFGAGFLVPFMAIPLNNKAQPHWLGQRA